MASFDIKSLFTNIPLNETVDICVEQCKNSIPFRLTVSEFRTLLELSVMESAFILN